MIPKELTELKQWVCWNEDKIPKNPYTGMNAKSNNPGTWGTYEEALEACKQYGFRGVGFMFAPPYFGVDLDHCIDKLDFVDEFVESLRSYNEYSVSGKGIHIICKGVLPDGARRKDGVEMYASGRYFICTGNQYNPEYSDIVDCTESIKVLHSKYLPDAVPKSQKEDEFIRTELTDMEVLEKARACKTGDAFQMLYSGRWHGILPSQSEADLALCSQLAFWCQRDERQIDRIFRSSGLMRDKWDAKRGEATYGEMTVRKACDGCAEVYERREKQDDTSLALALFGKKRAIVRKNYDRTDTGNANRLYDRFGGEIRYSYTRKRWYFWTGRVWQLDETGQIKKFADKILSEMKTEAFDIEDEEEQKAFLKFVATSANSSRKTAMITETQHIDGVPVLLQSFDTDPEYLNCQNGIINLRNGELIAHDQRNLMTLISNAEYHPEMGGSELWLSFLNDICAGDSELVRYLQKCVGYSLSGLVKEQCAFFLYGTGNNGKSTFLDTINTLLGTYASNAQPETVMSKRDGGGSIGSDIARLKSVRFVSTEEPEDGVKLNEGLVKQLTGGGKVTCRFLYGDEFEYEPEFKLWMATNHKPIIRGTDVGIWRRIRLIPFDVNIPPEKVDKNLKYKLRGEMSKILNWAVRGYELYKQEGINPPKRVQDATKEYKDEMDLLQSFMDSCVVIDYGDVPGVRAMDLYQQYVRWAEANNEYVMKSRKFFLEISRKLPEKKRDGKGVIYPNVRLIPQSNVYEFANFR